SATLLLAGMIAQDRGDRDTAEQAFARSAAARAGWAPPLANRGQVLLEMGRTEEALAILQLNRVDEAEKAFEHTLTLGELATTHFNLARIANMKNDVARAFERVQAAV